MSTSPKSPIANVITNPPPLSPPGSQQMPSRESQWSTQQANNSGATPVGGLAEGLQVSSPQNPPGPSQSGGVALVSDNAGIMKMLMEMRSDLAERKTKEEQKNKQLKELEKEIERLKAEKDRADLSQGLPGTSALPI